MVTANSDIFPRFVVKVRSDMLHAKRLLRKCSEFFFAFCEVVVVVEEEGGGGATKQLCFCVLILSYACSVL